MIENHLKTVLLLGLLTGLLVGIGSFWGYNGLIIGLVFAVVINFGSYFFSDKIVLAMYRAKEAKENDHLGLYRVVREVVHLAKIPMPKVYVINSANPNAFATGRNPNHSVVAVTTGLMELLERDELKGVIAHEVSHIKNRDILVSTIAATMAGVISYIAMVARWSAIFGFGGGRDGDDGIIGFLAIAIITPIMAMLIQLAISRSREYLADASAAKILHNPHGLIGALKKLDEGVKKHPLKFGSEAGASLFIVNPFSMKGMLSMLSTHPATEDRIKKLKNLA